MPGVLKSKAMQKSIIKTLVALTNRMYAEQSKHFSDTRSSAWTGWETCLPFLPTTNSLRILDVGCGNGRFGAFLRENVTSNREIEYVGVDSSQELLELASKGLQQCEHMISTFVLLDLIERMLAEKPLLQPNRTYEVISLFGVMHHIPSYALRTQLLQELSQQLAPGGALLISFWQFAEHERFTQKVLEPTDFGVDSSELEVGDFLLPWDSSENARYCHYADAQEQEKLLAATGLELLKTFSADGKTENLNTYHILQRA